VTDEAYEKRFRGVAALYGTAAARRLRAAHVAVIGIGGVGSWAAEALARSGIGALTLVDLDEVCASNMNRQLHALDATVGRFKVHVMAERIRGIHAGCQINAVTDFFTAGSAETILAPKFDCVVDAIDSLANKCRLIAACRARKLPVIVCGAAGGRRDATKVRTADLADATHDRLLSEVRRQLRKDHGFPADGKFGVDAVYTTELPVFLGKDGTVCASRKDAGLVRETKLNCNLGLGSATFVTGTFGFAAAGLAVKRIATGA
jgi:tRNA A37 threonylcarbamoyladenosine dehydratase